MLERHLLERKSVMLWKNLQPYILRQHQEGLSSDEHHLMQHMLKEHSQVNYLLNSHS